MVGFAVSETMGVTAQSNSTNSERRNIIVTWFEANKTKAPMDSISSENFWKFLSHFFNQSTDLRIHRD